MKWHQEVCASFISNQDGDFKLLSNIVENIILKKIIMLRLHVYDPFSNIQTDRALNLLTQLTDYLSLKSGTMMAFLKSIKDHCLKAVNVVKSRSRLAVSSKDAGQAVCRNQSSSEAKQFWIQEQINVCDYYSYYL